MVIQGHVENGVIVPHGSVPLPEGAEVTIMLRSLVEENRTVDDELRRQRESLDRLRALPDENPGDRFSGTDHDRALYGEP